MLLQSVVNLAIIIDTRSEHTIKGNSMVVKFQLRYTQSPYILETMLLETIAYINYLKIISDS